MAATELGHCVSVAVPRTPPRVVYIRAYFEPPDDLVVQSRRVVSEGDYASCDIRIDPKVSASTCSAEGGPS